MWGYKMVHAFLMSIYSKAKTTAWWEFEDAYYDVETSMLAIIPWKLSFNNYEKW